MPGGKTKIQIVESVRESEKVRQRILRHVGTVSLAADVERYKQMAEYIKADLEKEQKPSLFTSETLARMVIENRKVFSEDTAPLPVNLKNLREEHRIVSGVHEIYGTLYDSRGFGFILKGCPISSGIMKDKKNSSVNCL